MIDNIPEEEDFEDADAYNDFLTDLVDDIHQQYTEQTQFLDEFTEDSEWEKVNTDDERLVEMVNDKVDEVVFGSGFCSALFIQVNSDSSPEGWEEHYYKPEYINEAIAYVKLRRDVIDALERRENVPIIA